MEEKTMKEMSFLDHLEVLRWMLIRSTIAIVIAGAATFFLWDYIDALIFGPLKSDFITYRSLCDLSHFLNFGETICVTDLENHFIIQNTEMEGQMNMMVWSCITAGFILSFPYILWELWGFVSPALYDKEKKNAKFFIFVSSILFFLGVCFGYFVVVPMSINFFATFQVSDVVKNQFSLDSYISMIKTAVVASGLFFELPIVIYFLTKLGIVTPEFLRKYRKIAVVIVLIVAAIVTPPDVVSQVIVAVPMLIIFEASVILSAIVYKKQQKEALTS